MNQVEPGRTRSNWVEQGRTAYYFFGSTQLDPVGPGSTQFDLVRPGSTWFKFDLTGPPDMSTNMPVLTKPDKEPQMAQDNIDNETQTIKTLVTQRNEEFGYSKPLNLDLIKTIIGDEVSGIIPANILFSARYKSYIKYADTIESACIIDITPESSPYQPRLSPSDEELFGSVSSISSSESINLIEMSERLEELI